MINEKLKHNKKLFNEYITKKDNGFKSEEDKYNWFLTLEDIIFDYLGVNRSVFLNIEKFKNFPASILSSKYTEEETRNLINETSIFLEKVENEHKKLYKDIKLDDYTKSYIYKNRYFNCDIPNNNFNNIELISITTNENAKHTYYEVEETTSYKKKLTIDNKDIFYKNALGTFDKKNLKFNINKNYIKDIKILENNKEKIYTVKEFEKKYGLLSNFMYSQLKDMTLDSEDPLIKQAITLLSKYINVRSLPPISYRDNLISNNRKSVGEYFYGAIHITTKPTYSLKLEILIHEIGHYIHDEYFNEKQFRFSTKNKSSYAKKNFRENFAECFTELVFYKKQNERTEKMMKLLSEIV